MCLLADDQPLSLVHHYQSYQHPGRSIISHLQAARMTCLFVRLPQKPGPKYVINSVELAGFLLRKLNPDSSMQRPIEHPSQLIL